MPAKAGAPFGASWLNINESRLNSLSGRYPWNRRHNIKAFVFSFCCTTTLLDLLDSSHFLEHITWYKDVCLSVLIVVIASSFIDTGQGVEEQFGGSHVSCSGFCFQKFEYTPISFREGFGERYH